MDNPLSKKFREFILAPSHSRTISTLVILIIAAAIPLTVLVSQKQQELRQNAATTTATSAVCPNAPADIVIIIDKSGSMVSPSPNATRLPQAKAAAKAFVTLLAQNANNSVGVVSFNSTATTNLVLTPLTTAGATSVNTHIDAITAVTNVVAANTCIQCAVNKANQEITAHGRANIKKVVILLTDGEANFIEGGTKQTTAAIAEPPALAAVKSGNTASGTVFYTIGLGTSINTTFLTKIANSTGGQYFASPTSAQLTSIYTQISQVLGKGSITGLVFNDLNNNHVLDTSEPGLANWVINLFAGTNTTPQTSSTTDASGSYTIQGLCAGTYNLKEVAQTGWTQTLPTNPPNYPITIANGSSLKDKNFGNVQQTACTTGATGCSVCNPNTCGTAGTQTCTHNTTSTGSTACTPTTFSRACTGNTPVNGGLTTTWSACSATACGVAGTQTKTCTNPAPACGGAVCSGTTTQACTGNTPVNGVWSNWGTCSASCTQTRTCTNPAPACGGTACSGASSQSCTGGACGTTTCTAPSSNPHFECVNNTCVAVNTCAANSGGCTAAGGTCGITSPVCQALVANPTSVNVNGTSALSISCTGTTTSTTYAWTSSTCGTLPSPAPTTSTTTWTAPSTGPTSCPISVSVCNGATNCATGNVTIPVTIACSAPNITCSGVCVNPQTDNNNCGACGTVCTTGQTCTAGTCVSGHTLLAFTIGMDAIGSTGDQQNSDPVGSSNQSPQHTTRNLDVQIIDSNNNIASKSGSIAYNAATGLFNGTIDLGASFVSGNYTVKVKSGGHLRRLIPGTQVITAGATANMPKVTLVAGDINSTNTLTIEDYNILLSCITDSDIADFDNHALCSTANANYLTLSDLEDNGVVDRLDYNLFLREFSAANGD